MSDFKEDTKQNLKEGLRDRIESGTGIIGEALRAKREQKEKQKQIHEEVAAVKNTTAKIKMSGTTLTNMEKSFTQISENLQLIAKAFKAQTTTFEETQAAYQPQQVPQQRKQTTAVDKIIKNNEEDSLFNKVSSLIDGFETARKAYRAAKVVGRVAKGAAKGIAKGAARAVGKAGAKEIAKKASEAVIKTSARKILAKSLGKLVGKSIPIAGAAVGIGFAVSKMLDGDWVGAGVEAVSGLGSAITAIPATIYGAAREVYFDVYGTWPESDPNSAERYNDLYSIVKSMAADMLKDNVKANESDAETARLKRQAVPVSAPTAAAGPAANPPLPSTGAGGGRGSGGPSAAAAIKATLTPKQLKWLGDADPTDPYIMARMPKAEAVAQPAPAAPPAPPSPTPVAAPPLPAKPVAPPPVSAPTPAAPPPAAAAGAPVSAAKKSKTATVSGGEAAVEQALKAEGFDSTAIAAMMAQASHESMHFTTVYENLNYNAASLTGTFPKYFNAATAAQYERQPEKIAERVYGGRMGNGPEGSGDGYKYRGRGFIQLTGKDNYAAAGKSLGLDLVNNPDLAADPKNAAKIVIWYFKQNLKYITDWADVKKLTWVVNRGTIGLADRQKEFAAYMAKYNGSATAVAGAGAATGKELAQTSTDVASAKKANQAGSSVTVVAINNNTQTKVGATNRPPQSQTTAVVGA